MHAHHVGVKAEPARNVFIDVGVRIDHSRGHDLARNIDRFPRRKFRQVGLDRRDFAADDTYIKPAVAGGRRIDDSSAGKDEIVVRLHDVHVSTF